MEVDTAGNIYVADTFNSRICKVQPISHFPAPLIGQASSSQNVYLVINESVTISSFSVSQSEGSEHEYAVGTVTGCPIGSALTAGTICTISVTFSPTFPAVRVPLVVATTGAGEFNFSDLQNVARCTEAVSMYRAAGLVNGDQYGRSCAPVLVGAVERVGCGRCGCDCH